MHAIKPLLLALALTVITAAPSWAQNILSNTTLSSAVNTAQTSITLTSVTVNSGGASTYSAMAAGMTIFVDLEAMRVVSVSGTTVQVARGSSPTTAQSHPNAAKVLWGPSAYFQQADPPYGSCTAPVLFIPWINLRNGNNWLCRSSTWQATNIQPITMNSWNGL